MYTSLRLVRSKAATVRQRRCVVCWLCTSWNHDRPRQDNLLQAGKHRCCSNNMQRWKERVNIADELFLQASNSYKLVRSCAVSACMMSLCLTFYWLRRYNIYDSTNCNGIIMASVWNFERIRPFPALKTKRTPRADITTTDSIEVYCTCALQQCNGCEDWFHIHVHCVSVPRQALEVTSLDWFCKACKM